MDPVRKFPFGCKIVNIQRGTGARHRRVYAELRKFDGSLLITATLDYITEQILAAEIETPDEMRGKRND
jgi:hypothetical protein